MRDTTERPEGDAAGTLRLVGTDEETIYQNFKELLEDESATRRLPMLVILTVMAMLVNVLLISWSLGSLNHMWLSDQIRLN